LAVEAGVARGVVADALQRPDATYLRAARQNARAAAVTTAPTVLLDAKRLEAPDAIGLAERLQRELLNP
jgi:hypothetical protein